jgi:hypothetical protein
MKPKRVAKTFTEELIANAIGWIAGLLSVELLSTFFSVRSWKNGWGLFSRKATVSADTFELMEWLITAIVGFIVLFIVNRLVGNWLLNKIDKEEDSK